MQPRSSLGHAVLIDAQVGFGCLSKTVHSAPSHLLGILAF